MWKIIVLCIVSMGLSIAEKVTYKNYKLFTISPKTIWQLRVLQALRNMEDMDGYSFWKEPSWVDREILLMISSRREPQFSKMMTDMNIPCKLLINNIQKLIDDTMPKNQSQGFDFNSYHTLEEIYDNLNELAKRYPNKVEVVVGGKTYLKRDIKGVKIMNGEQKPGIFIEGGMHAREWISPATVMYILHQLLMSNDSNVRYVADNHNWIIFPVFNPDGYQYSIDRDRMWKKTLKPSSPSCTGSDPNKNWDFHWNTTGVNSNPCDENYPGSVPFSEIEMKTMSEYIRENSGYFYAYVSFHSFSQKLMFPYAYTEQRISCYDELYRVGSKAIESLQLKYQTEYQIGSISKYGLKSGLSVDYVAGVIGKCVVYLFELRDKGIYGFLLPPEQIIPTGEETLNAIIVMFSETLRQKYAKNN